MILSESSWILRFAPLILAGGAVLDVACGGGRHAHYFLRRGHSVTAIDRDTSHIAPAPNLSIIQADLENGTPWPLPDCKFAGIVVTNYLFRPLFPILVHALEPNGILVYETFAAGNEAYGRPKSPDFLLARGELLEKTAGLNVVAYEDGIVDGYKVVQRICAINGPGPGVL